MNMKKNEEISMTNTKKEMLSAYNDLLTKMEEKRRTRATTEQKIEQKQQEEVLDTANRAVTDSLGGEILNLKSDIGRMLNGLNEKLDAETERYEKIKQAVSLKEKELQDIYEIQKVASTLDALLETQRQKQEIFQAQMAQQKEELESEINDTRENWESEQITYDQDKKDRLLKEKRQRDRDDDDFKYKLDRDREQAVEQFEYEKKRMERELKLKRENLEEGLAEREKNIAAAEQELTDLRKKTHMFPAQLEQGIKKAAKEASDTILQEKEANEKLLKKEYEGQINVLTAQISAAQKTITEQNKQLERLGTQLERSYNQVQDIATTAIDGAAHKAAMQLATVTQRAKNNEKKDNTIAD